MKAQNELKKVKFQHPDTGTYHLSDIKLFGDKKSSSQKILSFISLATMTAYKPSLFRGTCCRTHSANP